VFDGWRLLCVFVVNLFIDRFWINGYSGCNIIAMFVAISSNSPPDFSRYSDDPLARMPRTI
jgi:hypothetical protein